ncbi:MAG TPA: zinc metallopeptidase, partial [Candidatus Fimenecus stercoravium]|nr:zinc metallopeptidase [Candidatus Fimenecus stercoravium]
VIRLSDGVFGSCSVAAVGIACHEAGHAAQYAQGYSPIKIRNSLLMPAQIGSNAAWPLAIIGFFLGSQPLVLFGIILYVAVLLFQLITLPVEFNASRRAVSVIEQTGLLAGAERDGAVKVLRAAAMTYVASFAVTAANLLRLLLLANNRRK